MSANLTAPQSDVQTTEVQLTAQAVRQKTEPVEAQTEAQIVAAVAQPGALALMAAQTEARVPAAAAAAAAQMEAHGLGAAQIETLAAAAQMEAPVLSVSKKQPLLVQTKEGMV